MDKLTVQELLFNDQPITINRKLAKCLGLKEAVVFQQIHYWLEINKKTNNNFKQGKYWTYNSIKEWQKKEFDFLSLRTVERTLKKLENDGLLETNTFNKMAGDKTKWYTINYDKLLEVCQKKLDEKETLSIKRSASGKKGAEAKNINNSENINTIQPTWQNGEPCNQLGRMVQPTWQNGTTNLAEAIPEITTKTTTKISTSSSSSIEKNSLIEEFKLNICELKKTTLPKFESIVENNNSDMVLAVIEECAGTNVKSYRGFEVAFNSYIERGCKSREDVVIAASKFRESKNKKKTTSNRSIDGTKENNSKKELWFNSYDQRENVAEKMGSIERQLLGWDK